MFGKKRVRFRPPGLKPTTKVGTLGPYRGRLGLAWVIAPIVAGVIIVVAGSGLTFEDAGEHELKGVPDRWRLYRVLG